MRKKLTAAIISAMLVLSMAACGSSKTEEADSGKQSGGTVSTTVEVTAGSRENTDTEGSDSEASTSSGTSEGSGISASTEAVTATVEAYENGLLDASELFSERDLTQTADTSEAKEITLSDGQDVSISEAGVYVISGTASETTITVDAADDAKVQLVLNGVSITNKDFPCIYVKSADKVFITTVGDNSLTVSGSFTTDGDTKTDAVIFSKDDITLNGTGTLTITSSDNGISGKDDVKVTGGIITISAEDAAIEANDSIRIADGTITVTASNDALHAENDDDDTVGYIYIGGGTLKLTAADDGIHGTSIVQIDGGTIDITAAECIEGTYIQINDGTINIAASDDGINAAKKSTAYTPTIEVNGGYITVNMGQGDTDGLDVNGNLYINGGTIDITAQSPFDYDGTAEYNGGTIIVNGEETNEITNQFMGGPGGGQGRPEGGFGDGQFPGGGQKPDNFDPNNLPEDFNPDNMQN
ncbi:MAG: carbohydrate-binding domain-containing protein [Eubacterium sp.]|nr:carbohydrate-binding domain-containing protein [Eubacterium sp.]